MNTDEEAYLAYPRLHHWFDKLWLSRQLGYNCGPGGIPPAGSGFYIIRPVMNLRGMGVNSKKIWIDAGDNTKTPPGHFWCDFFEGAQYSVTFAWATGAWHQISCFTGIKKDTELYKFEEWHRSNKIFETHVNTGILDELVDFSINKINVEFIEDSIIEVHLRSSPDPDYDKLIPIWKDTSLFVIKELASNGYRYIEDPEHADGFLEIPRKGFMVKNKEV